MRQRRYYNKTFKSVAVSVVRSGKSVNSVADILGVPRRTLRGWLNQNLPDSEKPLSQRFVKRWFDMHLEIKNSNSLKRGSSISLQVEVWAVDSDASR